MRWTGTALWEGPSATPWVASTIRVYPYNDTGASEAGRTEFHACYAAREKKNWCGSYAVATDRSLRYVIAPWMSNDNGSRMG